MEVLIMFAQAHAAMQPLQDLSYYKRDLQKLPKIHDDFELKHRLLGEMALCFTALQVKL